MKYISKLPNTAFSTKWPRKLVILGSTGSIGTSALKVIAEQQEYFQVIALAGGKNIPLLAAQANALRPACLAVQEEEGREKLASLLDYTPEILIGQDGYASLAAMPEADMVLSAQVGAAGLRGTWAAVQAGKVIALANKESLVLAGRLMRQECERSGAVLLPVDSEHNAIFQCLMGQNPLAYSSMPLLVAPNLGKAPSSSLTQPSMHLKRIILTASGGPFRGKSKDFLEQAGKEAALSHPTWNMGAKITIDSASLMNKGLEVIEACHLYGLPPDDVSVVIHPQSIIHSLVEFQDNSQLAQLGVPDMRVPIANCLGWPFRLHTGVPQQNFMSSTGSKMSLSFDEPDYALFPALGLCKDAYAGGRGLTVALNAANEIAVQLFLNDHIKFTGITKLVASTLEAWPTQTEPQDIEEILALDAAARNQAQSLAKSIF